eukprot:m.158820 g.158820  ORF g.158820 m.158820 type:complete len:546 (+) comp31109_c0_seq1:164-1801(+)
MIMMMTMASAMIVLVASYSALAQDPYLVFDPDSNWEFAFNYNAEACSNINPHEEIRGDQPDSMPLAWYNIKTNKTSFISATSQGIHASVGNGPTLNNLIHDCSRVVFNSTFNTLPSSYANHQWLQSVRLFANGTAQGLVHNEFKGEFSGNLSYCNCVINATHRDTNCENHCEMWSTGLASSIDFGDHFELNRPPPLHLVAALPKEFVQDQLLAGYGAISTMMRGSDGAFYGFINIAGDSNSSGVPPGNCPFRVEDLSDPTSYRGRDAEGRYTVQWKDPYVDPGLQNGHCSVVATTSESPLAPHVCTRRIVNSANSSTPTFISVGDHGSTMRYTFSYEQDYEKAMDNWTEPRQLEFTDAGRWSTSYGAGHLLYPVILDHESPDIARLSGDDHIYEDGINFAVTSLSSKSLYVYFVGSFRNILRRKVSFSRDAPPPAPPAPPPNDPSQCSQLQVSGAGEVDMNGIYVRTNRTTDECPIFAMGTTHQIYRVNISGGHEWHMGHYEVSVAYVNMAVANQTSTVPPISLWNLGSNASVVPPAPELVKCLP